MTGTAYLNPSNAKGITMATIEQHRFAKSAYWAIGIVEAALTVILPRAKPMSGVIG